MQRKKVVSLISVVLLLTGCGAQAEDTTASTVQTESVTESEVSEAETEIEYAEEATTTEQEPSNEPKQVTVAAFPTEAVYAQADTEAAPYELTLLSEESNHFSDYYEWLSDHHFAQAGTGDTIAEDTYTYYLTPNEITISDTATGEPLYLVEFEESIGAEAEIGYMGWAHCEDGVLYVSKSYNGYAWPNTCYLIAIDLETGSLLWRSEDQTCNAHNFIVKEDVILCCYGFTDEADYLYQIDKHTGKVLSRTDLTKMGDYLIEQDGILYIHGYDRDYEFQMIAAGA